MPCGGGFAQPPARGFSLVEVLVAVVVFALLSAAGVAVLAYAVDQHGIVRERLDRVQEFQRARALLRADLGQAAPRRARRADGSVPAQALVGTAGDAVAGMPLVALVRRGWSNHDEAPRASLQYVEYRLVEQRLERRTRPAVDGAALGKPQVVLAGVHGARALYHYRGQWLDGWPGGADAVPAAIRLQLELDGLGDVEQWFLMPGTSPSGASP